MTRLHTDFTVESTGQDEFRVPGVSEEELREALALRSAVLDQQAETAQERRAALLNAMGVLHIDTLPHATIAQAERTARLRERLLASGYHTYESLSDARTDSSVDAARMWVSRQREKGHLVTLPIAGRTVLPGFQFDDHGRLRPGVADVLGMLDARDFGPWQVWAWFESESPWLDGRRPIDLIGDDPAVVVRAARGAATH